MSEVTLLGEGYRDLPFWRERESAFNVSVCLLGEGGVEVKGTKPTCHALSLCTQVWVEESMESGPRFGVWFAGFRV